MSEIKEELAKAFPGQYTVLPPSLRDHLQRLFGKYPLPPQDREELTKFIANLPDAEAEVTLTELEEAAELDLRENVPLS